MDGGELTPSLERDFMRLNNLLAGLNDTIQDEVGMVSPFLKYMDLMAWRADETFVSYSINYARDRAWNFARELMEIPREEWEAVITARDEQVANFSRRVIASMRLPIGLLVRFVKLRESRDAYQILQVLSTEEWQKKVKSRVYDLLRHVEEEGLDMTSRDTQLFRVPDALKTKLE
jgi:hypothetical protein